jgi:hypothetical protein
MTELSTGARIATWVVGLLSLALSISITAIPLILGVEYDLTADTGILAVALTAPVLGLILVLRAGAHRMGALFLVLGLSLGLAGLVGGIPPHPDYLDWLLPLVPFANAGWMIFLSLTIVGLPLLFPTGRPPSPRWRPVLWVLLTLILVVTPMTLFSEEITLSCSDVWPDETECSVWADSGEPIEIGACEPAVGPLGEGTECSAVFDNPIGITGVPDAESGPLGGLLYGVLLAAAVLAMVSLGVRFYRADFRERQQIKLVLWVLGLFVGSTLLEALVEDVMGGFIPVMQVVDFLMWVAIPLSVFLAITRYRLYDIDRVISRTITYALVVGLLAAGVAGLATLIGTRFREPWVVAATTLAVAAVFNPLRRRIQVWIDRRFNRSRFDAQKVMDGFAGSLRDEVQLQAVVEGWVGVVEETMQPAALGVWVRE